MNVRPGGLADGKLYPGDRIVTVCKIISSKLVLVISSFDNFIEI